MSVSLVSRIVIGSVAEISTQKLTFIEAVGCINRFVILESSYRGQWGCRLKRVVAFKGSCKECILIWKRICVAVAAAGTGTVNLISVIVYSNKCVGRVFVLETNTIESVDKFLVWSAWNWHPLLKSRSFRSRVSCTSNIGTKHPTVKNWQSDQSAPGIWQRLAQTLHAT